MVEKQIEEEGLEQLPQHGGRHSHRRQRADDVAGDALDVLLTFTEFQAFRGMLLDYRTEGGQGQDISSGTVVTSLCKSSPTPASQRYLWPQLPPASNGTVADIPLGGSHYR